LLLEHNLRIGLRFRASLFTSPEFATLILSQKPLFAPSKPLAKTISGTDAFYCGGGDF
jgi:hypothetical protein